MAVVHTEAVAIFNGQLINETEDKIQYCYHNQERLKCNGVVNYK